MAKSIIQKDKSRCFLCGRNANADYFGLDEHHVYFGANRKKSGKYGLVVSLCHHSCHIFGKNAVHKNAKIDRALKAHVQEKAMKHYSWTTEEFIKIFGKNYI